MQSISLFHIILGILAIASIIVLFLQTVIEDPRIAFVALASQPLLFLFTKPGTNGAFLVAGVFGLAVLALMAPIMYKNIKRPHTWAPLVAITTAVSVFAFEYFMTEV